MKNYDVYFEVFGKKYRKTVLANSKPEAVSLVKEAIINKTTFHIVVETPEDDFNKCVDLLDKINNELDLHQKIAESIKRN